MLTRQALHVEREVQRYEARFVPRFVNDYVEHLNPLFNFEKIALLEFHPPPETLVASNAQRASHVSNPNHHRHRHTHNHKDINNVVFNGT